MIARSWLAWRLAYDNHLLSGDHTGADKVRSGCSYVSESTTTGRFVWRSTIQSFRRLSLYAIRFPSGDHVGV